MLIAGRAIQGVGTAMFFANSLSIVSNAFPTEQRGLGIGTWSAMGIFGGAIGPLIGGFLTEALSWRWFFFVNIPITVIAIALTLVAVLESKDETAEHDIDMVGFIAVTIGFVLLVLGIEQSTDFGWGSIFVIGSIIGAVVILTAFTIIELRASNPLIEFGFFRGRDFTKINCVAFLANYDFGAMMFFLTLYLQHILDFSPLTTGFVFLAFTVPCVLMSPIAGRVMPHWGARKCMLLGMLLLTVSFGAFTFINLTSGVVLVAFGLFVSGIGQGFAYNVSTAAGMAAVPEQKAGTASGVISTVRMIGLTLGVAVTGTLFKGLENSKLIELFTNVGANLTSGERSEVKGLLSGSDAAQAKLITLAPEVSHRIEAIVRGTFIYALDGAMILCLALSLLGVAAAILIKRRN